jgi:hypothetical protein
MPEGKFVLKDAKIVVDGTDLSKRASQVAIELPDDEVDLSTFGGDFKETGKGLSDASMTVTFFQDYAAGQVDEVLWPFKISDETFIIEVSPSSKARSATNPTYKMTARLFNYTPISGSVGQASTTQVTFKNASDNGIERLTS